MVANIELEKNYSFILHKYDGPSSSLRKSVENAHALIAHTYGMMSPIRSKLHLSSDEPRPGKIYLLQLCAQQRHISDCTDAHSNQNLSCPLQ